LDIVSAKALRTHFTDMKGTDIMSRTPWITLMLLVALAGIASAQASEFSLGLSSFGVIVNNEDPYDDDQLFGGAIVGTYAFNDQLAVRGILFSTTHNDDDELTNAGLEAHVLYGRNLTQAGFRYYGLGGFFSETWDMEIIEPEFSGLTLGFGIGYAWEKVALDWWGAWRAPSDYQDFIDDFVDDNDVTAASGALSLSYRF
jgi:hypothetical protein